MTEAIRLIFQGIQILAALGAGYFTFVLTSYFIPFRKNRTCRAVMVLGYSILHMMPILEGDAVNILGILLLYGILLLLLTHGSFINKISVAMIFFPIIAGINFIQYNNPVYSQLVHTYLKTESDTVMILWLLFRSGTEILKMGIWLLIYRFLKGQVREIGTYITHKIWIMVDIICLAPFLAIFISNIFPPSYTRLLGENTTADAGGAMSYLMIIGAVVSNLGIVFLLQPLIDNIKMRTERQTFAVKEEYYRMLEEQQRKIRKMRHDMNNHFQMVGGYLKEEDLKGARHYLEQFERSLGTGSGRQFCRDGALNAVINSRYTSLEKARVDLYFNIAIDSVMGIHVFDLCTIFSNALDNALEASRKIEDLSKRKVSLKARAKKGYFSFQLTNSKVTPVKVKHGRIVSDKSGLGEHGYGIENIRDIVKRYQGNLDIHYTPEEFCLFLYIKT